MSAPAERDWRHARGKWRDQRTRDRVYSLWTGPGTAIEQLTFAELLAAARVRP